jgi:hypothetical protein
VALTDQLGRLGLEEQERPPQLQDLALHVQVVVVAEEHCPAHLEVLVAQAAVAMAVQQLTHKLAQRTQVVVVVAVQTTEQVVLAEQAVLAS